MLRLMSKRTVLNLLPIILACKYIHNKHSPNASKWSAKKLDFKQKFQDDESDQLLLMFGCTNKKAPSLTSSLSQSGARERAAAKKKSNKSKNSNNMLDEELVAALQQQAPTDAQANSIDPVYAEFRDQSRFWIQRVAVPLIMVIGLFGNSITVVIMTRRRMRSTTNMYLAALAFVDMLYLVLTFVLGLSHYPNMAKRKYYLYWRLKPFLMMLTDACSNTSVWLTVTFTIERFIAVKYPMKGKLWCTEARAKKLIASVFAIAIMFVLPVPFEWKVIERRAELRPAATEPIGAHAIAHDDAEEMLELALDNTDFGRHGIYKTIYYWLTAVLFYFLPLISVTLFNCFLIHSVHRSKKERRRMTNQKPSNTQQYQSNNKTKSSSALKQTSVSTCSSDNNRAAIIASSSKQKPPAAVCGSLVKVSEPLSAAKQNSGNAHNEDKLVSRNSRACDNKMEDHQDHHSSKQQSNDTDKHGNTIKICVKMHEASNESQAIGAFSQVVAKAKRENSDKKQAGQLETNSSSDMKLQTGNEKVSAHEIAPLETASARADITLSLYHDQNFTNCHNGTLTTKENFHTDNESVDGRRYNNVTVFGGRGSGGAGPTAQVQAAKAFAEAGHRRSTQTIGCPTSEHLGNGAFHCGSNSNVSLASAGAPVPVIAASSQERRITIMLIAVVLLFLVCQIPSAAMLLYTSVHETKQNTNENALLLALGNIFNFLMAINAAGNFILYSFLSKKYRRTFVILFCNCFKSSKASNKQLCQRQSHATNQPLTVKSVVSSLAAAARSAKSANSERTLANNACSMQYANKPTTEMGDTKLVQNVASGKEISLDTLV